MAKKVRLELDFDIGDKVFLTTDNDQIERLVIGIYITPLGIIYVVANGVDQSEHYAIELSSEKPVI